ncbi:jg874 [Pararge aegeria aegeria]|uniref:Jg874 protein n=1 Tax=Pararge aegeria aegeria TaxID=348720 RepID=A0A8S4QZG5_9NEOP|nr:jg874 [Pararge aegeria aegeria]
MLVAEKKEMEEKEINKRTDNENNGHPDPQNNYQAGRQTYSFKNESEIWKGPDSSSSPSPAGRSEGGSDVEPLHCDITIG